MLEFLCWNFCVGIPALEFLRLNFAPEPATELINMNLQYDLFHLALFASPPAPAAKPADDEETPRPANDNHRIWPLMPFPDDWCASN